MANIFNKLFGKKDVGHSADIIEKIENQNSVKEEKNMTPELKEDEVQEKILDDSSIDFTPVAEDYEKIIEEPVEEDLDEHIIAEDTKNEAVTEEPKENPEYIEKPQGFFEKLKMGLTKTREGIKEKVDGVLANFRKIDEELFEELEEMLIMSDIGVETTQTIINNIKSKVKFKNITEPQEIKDLLKEEINTILTDSNTELNVNTNPSVIVFVGVNGVGKTTSIGKIANILKNDDKKVILGAGDTFRAAAIDQLEIWAKKVGVDIIKHQEGADPGAVVYDTIQAAKARKADIIICDTAGRLHNKKNLMDELGKIQRIIDRELPECSKEVLLVLDATTGQNAVQQAKTFSETIKVSGIVLTKLDGTAKGGIVITIKSELNIPVKFVGLGEGINDLQKFDSQNFVDALFE